MTLSLAAYHLFLARPSTGILRVHLLTDEPLERRHLEWRRMLAPWSDWLHVRPTRALSSAHRPAALADAGIAEGDVVVAMTRDKATIDTLRKSVEGLGARLIVPAVFPPGSRDADYSREVLHFDFELGGKHEWRGATLHAAHCLRLLSAAHCADFYPEWALDPLCDSRRSAGGPPLKVMDVGCGPISLLRWGALYGRISITGVDPLLPLYRVVLARHGLDALPSIRCDREIAGVAEELDRLVPEDDFDAVYTRNALDHTQRPAVAVEQMARRLRPGGVMVIEVLPREGTRQNWDQLHQTDIYLEDGVLMYCHRGTPGMPLIPPASRLRLSYVRIDTPDWLSCKLEKR